MESSDLDSYFDERPVDSCFYELIEVLLNGDADDDLKQKFGKIKSDLETSNTSFAKKKRNQIRDIQPVWDDYVEFLNQAQILKLWNDHSENISNTRDPWKNNDLANDGILFRYRGIIMEYNAKITAECFSSDTDREWKNIKAKQNKHT